MECLESEPNVLLWGGKEQWEFLVIYIRYACFSKGDLCIYRGLVTSHVDPFCCIKCLVTLLIALQNIFSNHVKYNKWDGAHASKKSCTSRDGCKRLCEWTRQHGFCLLEESFCQSEPTWANFGPNSMSLVANLCFFLPF